MTDRGTSMETGSLHVAGIASPPPFRNEVVLEYLPGSRERAEIEAALRSMERERIELPLFVGGAEIRTGHRRTAVMPHNHAHVLADVHLAGAQEVSRAIEAARQAARWWSRWPWEERAAVFLKAAELLSGPWRARLNAATMLGQSKTVHQAEIDSAAELVDFLRFNVESARTIYEIQPLSPSRTGVWNRVDYRPLEGFVLALTPFNFTAIAGNLPTAPALLGNTVIWKPAATAAVSAHVIMELLQAAGLPDGVINLVHGDPAMVAGATLADPDLAGIHFTGSTAVFNSIAVQLAANISRFRAYPRLVGETGGKNFVVAHQSADLEALATAIIRGAFEYQGQKCSAASRLFVPSSLWRRLKSLLCDEIATIRMGDVADFGNFMGAVINEAAWSRLADAIEAARAAKSSKVLTAGRPDKDIGYFIPPTLIETTDLRSPLMTEELFGPVAAAYVFEDNRFDEILQIIDAGSPYGLTGALFAADRAVIQRTMDHLRNAAGNFYINDKPTGAVVGQQPFGGGRASGTNDKAGSVWNLTRWLSPRSIKETFVPPRNYRYQFMQK